MWLNFEVVDVRWADLRCTAEYAVWIKDKNPAVSRSLLNDEQDIFGYIFISVNLIEDKLISRTPNCTGGIMYVRILTYRHIT